MSRRGRRRGQTGLSVVLVVAGLWLGVAGAQGAEVARSADSFCRDPLPIGLDLALPLRGTPRASPRTIENGVEVFFRSLYQEHGRCPEERDLQVNISFGDDYQILHWLEQGLVDVAVVPELSLDLLQREGHELTDIPLEGRPGAEQIAPGWATAVRSTLFTPASAAAPSSPGQAVPGPERGVEADLDTLLARTVCAADCVRGWDGPDQHPFAMRSACTERCRDGALPIRLAVDGYLASSALPALVGELAPRVTAVLLARPDDERDELEALLWQLVLDRTVFLEGGAATAWPPPMAAGGEPVDRWVSIEWRSVAASLAAAGAGRDRLVVRGDVAEALGALGPRPKSRWDRSVLDLFLRRVESAVSSVARAGSVPPSAASFESRSPAFDALLESEPYYGVRTFAFSLPEVRALLARNQRNSGRDHLALVLPGGGVKAIYQSILVDALYGSGTLRNVLTPVREPSAEQGAEPLVVEQVIGTSGGALLGSFVARLGPAGPWELSEILWKNERDEILESTDIFGTTDILRYVSVIFVFLVLCLVLLVFSTTGGAPLAPREARRHPAWRPGPTLFAFGVLLVAPFAVRVVSGEAAREHIPEVEGFFFALLVGAVMFADQCLVVDRERPRARPGRKLPGWVLVAVGLALVIVPALARSSQLDSQTGAFLVCLGLPVLLAGGLAVIHATGRSYRFDRPRDFATALGVALVHVVLVYGVLLAVMLVRPGLVSPLELMGSFWTWLFVVGLVVAVLLVVWGATGRPALPGSRTLARAVRYLASDHPNGVVVSRRFLRMAALAVFGLFWWNLVLAPALYGNGYARNFLEHSSASFVERFETLHGAQPYRFTASFLTPANALERDGTRYFLIVPAEARCPTLPPRPGSGARWHVYHLDEGDHDEIAARAGEGSSCQTLDLRTLQDEAHVRRLIFASGSPFPIFPAHRVPLRNGRSNELETEFLVDGGYSNNVPVDAALTVDAEQVLIIKSSHDLQGEAIRGPGSALAGGAPSLWEEIATLRGPLLKDLGRLPGFLFERSQQVDRLSRADLFVVSLSPARDEPDWPPLFDFRRETVERLRGVAQRDLDRRIGSVESWGRPRARLSVRIEAPGGAGRDIPAGVSPAVPAPSPRAP